MNTTTVEPTTISTTSNTTVGSTSTWDTNIIFGVGGGGGGLLLIVIVIVVVVLCLRRRRRKEKEVAPPMPDLEDPPLQPDSPCNYQRRNSDTDINNARSEERRNNDFQLLPISAGNSRSQPMAPEIYDSSDDDDDDKDYVNTGNPDYENNPISVAKAKAEADQRLWERRNGPSAPLGQSQVVTPSPRLAATPLRHAHTMKPEVNAGSGGTPPVKTQWSPVETKCVNRGHTPWVNKSYINTSKSLEELHERVVPSPPSIPSNSSLAKRKPPGPAPPPKSHAGKVKGYVNQPLAETKRSHFNSDF